MHSEREREMRRDFIRSTSLNVEQSLGMMKEYDEDEPELLSPEDLDADATQPTRHRLRR